MDELLAKSPSKGHAVTLFQHTGDVIGAGEALFGCDQPTRLGLCWLRFFKIDLDRWPVFRATMRAAAAFHDLGKANDGFQKAVRHRGDQAIRHEHLSGLIMFHPPVWGWLHQGEAAVDWEIALSAVLTHHLKVTEDNLADCLQAGSNWMVRLPAVADPALAEVLALVHSGPWPVFPTAWSFEDRKGCESLKKAKRRLVDHLCEFESDLEDHPARARLLRAVRAGLVAADAAGSGIIRHGKATIAQWIQRCFELGEICDSAYIDANILQPRIANLGERWRGWHSFQVEVAKQDPRTLLLAPCGSGKTLAAWKWIEAQAATRPVRRVIFLYPTRATATEGFRDYVSWAPEGSLLHGTAEYDLDGMFENPGDVRSDRDYTAEARLFAIGFWDKRIFSATVDQFFGFLQYAYSSVCMLPVLADSILVVDEVHSFDQSMFSALKKFLVEFDIPVLCMTATLTRDRIHQLENHCGLAKYDNWTEDLWQVARAPRYQIHVLGSREEAITIALQGLKNRQKILWVVNTVARAQGLFRDIQAFLAPEAAQLICYHSRFTLADRKARHQEAVDTFRQASIQQDRAALAITTQVCEMSLDLDADILISETCPIPAAIQRMGRCNRKTQLPLPALGQVYMYAPENELPYSPEDLVGVPAFFTELAHLESVRQYDLEAALAKHCKPALAGDRLISFTASGPFADSRAEDFRELDEHAVPGILDLGAYLAASRTERPGLIVPVPRKFRARRCEHPDARHLVLAPAERYDPHLGLCDPSAPAGD